MRRGFVLVGPTLGRPATPGKTNALFSSTRPSLALLRLGNQQRALRRMRALDQAAAAQDLDASFRHEPERQRINSMLDLEHAGGECFGAVVVAHRYRRLRNDGTGIRLGHDKVNGGARYLHAGLECLSVRIETWKRRQEAGVDVEHAALPMPHELRRQQPHETAETNQLCAMRIEHRLERALETGTIFPMRDRKS